jgi:plasmid maintenance system antidote protein VapI
MPDSPDSSQKFDPDWVVKPGATLRDWIEENHLTVRSTATCCHLSPEDVERIIAGKRRIGRAVAAKLQAGTGIPASLWLNLERAYRAGLRAGKVDVDA